MKKYLLALASILIICKPFDSPAQNTTTREKEIQKTHQVSTTDQSEERRKAEERARNDWANLSRFREENAKLGKAAQGENRIVFMGNSITEGWSRIRPDFFAGKQYINRGISGQTTPQMLIRFRPDVINLQPAAVIILAGINDIAGNTGPSTQEMIEDNLSSMVELAKASGISVILCSVLPAYDFPWRPGMQPAEKVVQLNVWIKKYAETHGCIYVDYFTPMADDRKGLKSEFTTDGVHPNEVGYRVMEPLAEDAIKQSISERR